MRWDFVFCGFWDLKGDFDRLLFEPITKFVVDFVGDFGASLGEVGVGFSGFVDEDEGGFAADTDAVEELAFEAGLFDKPTGVDFVAVFATVDGIAFVFGDLGFVGG